MASQSALSQAAACSCAAAMSISSYALAGFRRHSTNRHCMTPLPTPLPNEDNMRSQLGQ